MRTFKVKGRALLVGGAAAATLSLAGICMTCAIPQKVQAQGDPLLNASSYSLYIRPSGRDPERYFPLGMLFPRDTGELISYGYDFTELSVGPLLDPKGSSYMMEWFGLHNRPVPLAPTGDNLGLFVASWGWHLIPRDHKVGNYGPFPREKTSYFDPTVRDYLLAADTALAKKFGVAERPTLMWSLDNEWEGELDYSSHSLAGFATYLQKTHGTIAALNSAWGTNYTDWKSVEAPQSQPRISNPAAWLDWHAYQDGYFTQMTADRYRALYENDPLHRPVAHKSTQQSFDLQTVGKKRVLDPAQLCELTRRFGGWYGVDIYGANDTLNYEVNFAAQCIRPLEDTGVGKLFLTEVNNHGGPGWEWSNSLWRTLANGTKAYNMFCFGMAGASSDSDIYGMTAPNTLLRGKAPYAARFAYAVRRTEAFWERSLPAKKVRRVALLLNRPDVLLADDIPGQMWTGPTNSRTKTYAALRQAGYWVDVLPYTKMDAAFLAQYDALVVVAGDHLTPAACGQISNYVRQGGVLVADRLAGFYDLHHQARRGLEPILGVHVASPKTAQEEVSVSTEHGRLTGQGGVEVKPVSAQAVGGASVVFRNTAGKGKALFVNAELGAFKESQAEVLSRWLAGLLQGAGVQPAYASPGGATATASLRVEQPWTANGNLALVVANVVEKKHDLATIDIQLPPGEWDGALWAPAESAELVPVPVNRAPAGRYRFRLPAFATAGTLLLFPNHPPLISVTEIATKKRGVDGYLPALKPGEATRITATLVNPASIACPAGKLRIQAMLGWNVSMKEIETPRLPAGGQHQVTFTVTPPDTGVLPYTERMYPINLRWSNGKQDLAVTTTPVGVDIENERCPYILTENATYPADFPRRIQTGATYRYLNGEEGNVSANIADPGAAGETKPGMALKDGTSRWLMASESAHFHMAAEKDPAIILVDLKEKYPLQRVRIQSSGAGGFPIRLEAAISSDGKNFTPVGTAVPEGTPGSAKWLEVSNLEGKSARYIRMNVTLQNGDGFINEVEVWGFPRN